ncbi:hypothetical protein ABID26_002165 [Mesorhizobium shonense]|uniref:DUF779 domain-containing protein n=1 Tax=Mesorhizobium shonense TaxID=1209948 RepID=A0ABV2HRJ4_9HYPH
MDKDSLGKVSATPEAEVLLAEIIADHGPVLFHQSGGCCDGSSPMCYPRGEFMIGDNDVRLGEIGDTPGLYQRLAIRGVEAHRPHHRRRAGQGRHVLARQWPREAVSDALDGLCRVSAIFEELTGREKPTDPRRLG